MPRKKAAVKSEAEEMTEVLNAKTMERPVSPDEDPAEVEQAGAKALCPSRFRGQ